LDVDEISKASVYDALGLERAGNTIMVHDGLIIPALPKAWQSIITVLSSVPHINIRLVLRDLRPQRLTANSNQ